MQLDSRSQYLLREVMANPNIRSKELETKLRLSRRQLGYSFEKINEWLYDQSLPKIERTKQGGFLVEPELLSKLELDKDPSPEDIKEQSKSKRVNMILFMLLSRIEELSLTHFTSELKVSKNTVLDDLKKAKIFASRYGLNLRYSRKFGYLLEGKEFNLRKLMILTMYRVLEMDHGPSRVKQLAELSAEEVNELQTRVEKVEGKLNLKFTDEKIISIPYILALILRRVKQGKRISPFHIHYDEISDTKEYWATEEILYHFEDVPEEERFFITLHLLTANVIWSSEDPTEENIPKLAQALEEMLLLFERTTFIFLQDKERLIHKLLLHMKPAYYRIKYQLTEVNDLHEIVNKDFKELHHLVQKSTQPLADLIGSEIPESETIYLTMLIGGWLTKQGDSFRKKVKALVVCPKGVSVSRLMLSTLKDLFPEFVFLDSLSVREFQHYGLDYDVVFSPVFLETKKELFIAHAMMEKEERIRLRKQVMLQLYGYTPHHLHLEEILEIVEKHVTVKDRPSLAKELREYLSRDEASGNHGQQVGLSNPNLYELITPDTITLKHSVHSWEDGIKTASEPLLQQGSITKNYVEAMIRHCQTDPYIVISPHMAIPHASPDEGVKEVSMSLLRLKRGVEFAKDYSIHLVIIIAAMAKNQHLRALMQLMELAANPEDRNAMIQARSATDIHEIIKNYAESS